MTTSELTGRVLRSAIDVSAAATRLGWALSPAGHAAACKIPGHTGIAIEVREPFTTRPRRLVEVPALTLDSETFVADDGALTVVTRESDRLRIRTWPTMGDPHDWASSPSATTRVLPGRDGALYGVTPDGAGTRIARMTRHEQQTFDRVDHRVVDVRPLTRSTLICTVAGDGNGTRAVQYDTVTGVITDFVNTTAAADDRVVAIQGDTVVATTTATGQPRVGWGSLQTGRLRFPSAGAAERSVRLLGLADDGRLALLAEDRGMVMRLREVDLVTDATRELATVTGQSAGSGRRCGARWRFPMADLTHGTTMVELDQDGGLHHDGGPVVDAPPGSVTTIAGPGGSIEALVVGDPATAERVVIALHGGPMAAWRATHHPLFAELAADGTAVIAPNIRGSIGYGHQHAYAIRDNWGGPDRADVLAVANWLRMQRSADATPPVVLGESYGAFLAVLCAATAPRGTWSGCVGVAAFTSGQRIQDLGTGVSALVRRLGGASSPDLLALAADVPVPLLLLHGDRDDTVPVSESVALAEAIRMAGGTVHLVRDPDAGHDLLCSPAAAAHRRRICVAVRATEA